jgi:GNAT superfamily N-acetyltransferase
MNALAGNNAASRETWRAFVIWLIEQRHGRCDAVSALAWYLLRRWDTTRHDWRRDPSDFTARDLFDSVRRDWRGHGLGESALTQTINEFLDFLWARATGADGWRGKH